MDPETIEALVVSHDELSAAVQACMACILKHNLLDALDAFLFGAGVAPGFSERAVKARHDAMRERIIHIC